MQLRIKKHLGALTISIVVWALVIASMIIPFVVAAQNPLQAGRNPAYIVGGLAGVVALALLLMQPLLVAGYLPGIKLMRVRDWHRRIGIFIFIAVVTHIVGLYLTSPDDMSDALLLVAPTPYSLYGVIALWAILLTVILVFAQKRIGLSYSHWNIIHNLLAAVVVLASVVHTLMIEGTMGGVSKFVLCVSVLFATAVVLIHLRVIRPLLKA